ncbi:hypothetical protein [Streptomyces luteolus]|uniref:Uncharacterized protein n=1 Tax=Streptomyces luteolus TaxID=3043615 RepID=A0ABT6T6Q9_9ACTN|nr:hypothetical protein [Streptomyces sp. B-S-A12]MDI3423555.1 hypothetical protein [Streptomyces sp. B-S-A12]
MDPAAYPEVKSWIEEHSGSLDSVDFLTRNASLGTWLAIYHVIWPDFVEVEGCVLWRRSYEVSNFREWFRRFEGDVPAVEATLNRLILGDIIENDDLPEDRAVLMELAEMTAKSWGIALRESFPSKSFEVGCANTEDGPVVWFHSVHRE